MSTHTRPLRDRMETAELKSPPKFAKNEWAWAYTLNKLRVKDMIDDAGNPTNYAAAGAIYKRVVAKYGDGPVDLPAVAGPSDGPLPDGLTRAKVIDMDTQTWHVSRGVLWSATEERHQRLWLQTLTRAAKAPDARQVIEPAFHWKLEAWYDGVAAASQGLYPEIAVWLVRESRAGTAFVRSRIEAALADLDELVAELLAEKQTYLDGTVGACEIAGHQVNNHFLDFDASVELARAAISRFEESLSE